MLRIKICNMSRVIDFVDIAPVRIVGQNVPRNRSIKENNGCFV